MTTPADYVRDLCGVAIMRLQQVLATSGPSFADAADIRLNITLAIHDCEIAVDTMVRHGLHGDVP